MNRFIYIGDDLVNVNEIVSVENRSEYLDILFKDGKRLSIEDEYDIIQNQILGEDFIIQVIPCTKPFQVHHSGEVGEIYRNPIYYLGLCASGRVRPLEIYKHSGVIFADDASNYLGLYTMSAED